MIDWSKNGKREIGYWRGVARFTIKPNLFPEEGAFVLMETLPHDMISRHPSVDDAKAHAERRARVVGRNENQEEEE